MNPKEILKKTDPFIEMCYMLTELKEHVEDPIKQKIVMAEMIAPVLEAFNEALVTRDIISELELVYELSRDTGLQEIFHEAGFKKGIVLELKNRMREVEKEIYRQNREG